MPELAASRGANQQIEAKIEEKIAPALSIHSAIIESRLALKPPERVHLLSGQDQIDVIGIVRVLATFIGSERANDRIIDPFDPVIRIKKVV